MNLQKLFLFLLITVSCTPVNYSTNTNSKPTIIEYNDKSYQDYIQTVQIVPVGPFPYASTPVPVIPLSGETRLLLKFDDLNTQAERYMAKIIHLNADWTPSRFPEMDYLFEYNEFRVDDYDIAIANSLDYIHYEFLVPQVKVSGNYLIKVYPEGYENDIVLTKRFVVFENRTRIFSSENQTGFNRFSGHNIDFNVNYSGSGIEDPFLHLKATLRQNNRWDNALYDLGPTQVRDDLQEVRFQSIVSRKSFEPGNEFRFFDIRSVISPGQNIVAIDRESMPMKAEVGIDKSRGDLAYTFFRDLNGEYMLENYDGRNPDYASHYIKMLFTLKNSELSENDSVYVLGAFNQWAKNKNSLLTKISEGIYTKEILIKQGYYSYLYHVESETKPEYYLEGSFINTENTYEIFIYDTNPLKRNQECIGYYTFGINERIR